MTRFHLFLVEVRDYPIQGTQNPTPEYQPPGIKKLFLATLQNKIMYVSLPKISKT